jgi:signal peptidase
MATKHKFRLVLDTSARWLMRLVLLTFALVVLASLVVVVLIPRASNGAALTVLTGSMSPQIPVGSVILIRPVDPRTLQVGDVATYQAEEGKDTFITHRITKVHVEPAGLSFTFKGDANAGADLKPVPQGAIRGEVWFHVPYLGAIRDALHGKGGISLVAMLLVGGYALSQLAGGLRDHRSRRTSKEAGPDSRIDFVIDRTLVLAQFPRSAEDDFTAEEAARRWGAIVVAETDSDFSVLIAPPEGGVSAAIELLKSQDPKLLHVLESRSRLLADDSPLRERVSSAAFLDPQADRHEVETHAAL